MANKGSKHLNSFANDEHDEVEYRKRVATYIDGATVSYEDANFDSEDSLTILDVFTDLKAIGHEGSFINDGPGDIKVEISADGALYGGQHTLRGGEILSLSNLKIKKIRLTYIDNTGYRAIIG